MYLTNFFFLLHLVNLLTFYMTEYKHDDLYVKYLKELAFLHEKCHNQAEAGFTILRYDTAPINECYTPY